MDLGKISQEFKIFQFKGDQECTPVSSGEVVQEEQPFEHKVEQFWERLFLFHTLLHEFGNVESNVQSLQMVPDFRKVVVDMKFTEQMKRSMLLFLEHDSVVAEEIKNLPLFLLWALNPLGEERDLSEITG